MRYGWKWGFSLLAVSVTSFLLAAFAAGWTWDDAANLLPH